MPVSFLRSGRSAIPVIIAAMTVILHGGENNRVSGISVDQQRSRTRHEHPLKRIELYNGACVDGQLGVYTKKIRAMINIATVPGSGDVDAGAARAGLRRERIRRIIEA